MLWAKNIFIKCPEAIFNQENRLMSVIGSNNINVISNSLKILREKCFMLGQSEAGKLL